MRVASSSGKQRCSWAQNDPLMQRYHDREWGVPMHSDRKLFEFLILEGAQAGLSWSTILRKRPAYREAFANFDFKTVAGFTQRDVRRLLSNADIVRNRLKIAATVSNAKATLAIRAQFGSLDHFVWRFVGDKPLRNRWKSLAQIPAHTKESDAMSGALREAGFTFVGSTICYAFMQAVGMVNDHVVDCFRWREVNIH